MQVYKLLLGLEDRDMSTFFTPSSTDLGGHSKKLFKCTNWLQLRRNSFSQRVIDKWNQLPEQVVSPPSINAFKSRFNVYTQKDWNKSCPPLLLTKAVRQSQPKPVKTTNEIIFKKGSNISRLFSNYPYLMVNSTSTSHIITFNITFKITHHIQHHTSSHSKSHITLNPQINSVLRI